MWSSSILSKAIATFASSSATLPALPTGKTTNISAVFPYGLLVRVWPRGNDSGAKAYSSPVDGSKWWALEQQILASPAGYDGMWAS
eukprot:gene6491-8762_t